jgi:uncharacterized protein (DUF58 family)
MIPTLRAAAVALGLAAVALLVPVEVTVALVAAFALAVVGDAFAGRRRMKLDRELPAVVPRGVPVPLRVTSDASAPDRVELRQPLVPDVSVEPAVSRRELDARLVARRRGRHTLPAVAARRAGPLGLGSWLFRGSDTAGFVVFPDTAEAFRIVSALRRGRFRDPGLRTRGPLGLGTEFESIRDYSPDDDVRQINWRATARVGRPMSNQHRVEQDRDVVCLLDSGRLMAAPTGTLTRLDAAVDAVTAVAMVADEVGDRCGVIAFDRAIRRTVRPRRRGADAVIRAIFDVEAQTVDSDYELAFRLVSSGKRALVLVLSDIVDEAAAQSLLEAVPVLVRRHAVVVASIRDPDLDDAVTTPPARTTDVYAAAVALDVLDARARVVSRLRAAGADVVEAPPDRLPAACVRAYLRMKERARL